MKPLGIAALRAFGKLLAVFVFVATSLASCGTVFYASSLVFHPERTDFANGEPPADFLVAIENRDAAKGEEAFEIVGWNRVAAIAARNPDAFRLSLREYSSPDGDPWGFRVIDESTRHQIIKVHHRNTRGIDTKYRVEGGRITPLAYKTDGGVGLAMILLPAFLACLWLGWLVARRTSRWASATIRALDAGEGDHPI